MTARQDTAELLDRLRRHYLKPGPFPGGVFVPECGINGGAQQRVDALYVGFTSTSGRLLVGHELKVTRADWRRELDDHGKADLWADNCHAWYIVAPSEEVVPREEVPNGWGLMVPNPRTKVRMSIVVKAKVHDDRIPSWQITRSILARLDTLQAQHDNEVHQAAVDRAREEHERLKERDKALGEEAALTPEQRAQLQALQRVEEILGRPVVAWLSAYDAGADKIDARTAGGALRLLSAINALRVHGDRYGEQALRQAAQAMLAGLDEYEAARRALLELGASEPF